MALPIMRKATAVWLVDNTHMTFKQIAEFTGLHELEIQGIADGEVAVGVKGFDPIVNNQLTQEELDKATADPKYKMELKHIPNSEGERQRKGPRYTPITRRENKPKGILWLVRNHPELTDPQISKLIGTTKPTITAIRERTHWNINNLTPEDPVGLGLTMQIELDEAVAKAAAKAAKDNPPAEAGETIVSAEESLANDADAMAQKLAGFTLDEEAEGKEAELDTSDPDALFNLPKG